MKIIKDPIYGYLEIEDGLFQIIDSIYFQRLRNIIQTSYTSIYPSSLHNRFSHSLGVYWLGHLSFASLLKNSREIVANIPRGELKEIQKTFELACLCHDIGHSPFSHTGEKFYPKNIISDKLIELVGDEQYESDLKRETDSVVGKEHEIMSALLSLETFRKIIKDKNFSLFARCIIGLKYHDNQHDDKTCFLNACVELLNSKVIDVDKLDYLIRDSYMSGYMSVTIDYLRLIKGLYVSKCDGYSLGFDKSALSVLESTLTAYDMECRWIQGHPIILYEDFIIKSIIRELENKYNSQDAKLFSLSTLKEDGVDFRDGEKIRLLSDADILHLAKKNYDEIDAVKEYFNRELRRHPIWKSEAEFKALFDFSHGSFRKFLDIIKNWEIKLLDGRYGVYSLCPNFYEALEKELCNAKQLFDNELDKTKKDTYQSRVNKLSDELNLLKEIKEYLDNNGIPFDLVIITQKQFKRSISKPAFKNLPIRFNNINFEEKRMSEVSTIPLDMQEENNFFYIYYKRNKKCKNIDVKKFSKKLSQVAYI